MGGFPAQQVGRQHGCCFYLFISMPSQWAFLRENEVELLTQLAKYHTQPGKLPRITRLDKSPTSAAAAMTGNSVVLDHR